MPRRSRARRQEEDLWFVVKDRRRTRPDYILQARWDLTAAVVANYVAREVGAPVDIVTDGRDGRPVVVAANTMVCQPPPGRRTNHRWVNPYTYRVRRE